MNAHTQTNAVDATAIPALAPNKSAISAHLYALFDPAFVQAHPEAWIEIAYGQPDGNLNKAGNFSVFDLEKAVDFAVAKNAAGNNVYVGAAIRHGDKPNGRANGDHVVTASHAWVEYDAAGDDERIAGLLKTNHLMPAIVGTTGTVPHARRHLYLKLDGAVTPAKLKAANASLKTLLDSDDVQNPDRIMRLAGTVNYPSPKKRLERGYVTELTTLIINKDARGYSVEELIKLAPATDAVDHIAAYGKEGITAGRTDAELIALLKASQVKNWHNNMRSATSTMIGRGMSDSAIKVACAAYCEGETQDTDLKVLIDTGRKTFGKPNVEAREIVSAAQAIEKGAITQDGIARIFAERFTGRLRYCHHAGAWYEWTGSHWQRDEKAVAFQFVRELGRELSDTAKTTEMKEVRRVTFAGGVERFAQSDPAFAVTSDDWDRDFFLLGTPAGTVDLMTGKLREPNPAEGITKVTLVAPSQEANCPRWLQFLQETFGDDHDIARFLQQWAGYCLTGDIREHALFFGTGDGGNGKGVWLHTLSGILKDYAVTATMQTFTASSQERHSTELAMLRGARMVTASETEKGHAWAEARIKQMTGGDPITCRFMRQDDFTYVPQFKMNIIGNHKPELRTVDAAARRRFNIIPFDRKPAVVDRELEGKLMGEAPGILRWMIDGCLDWQKNGLVRPQSVLDATNDYFSDQDSFSRWIEECCDCEPGNTYKTATAAELYQSWKAYALAAGEDPETQKSFADRLLTSGKGIMAKRTNRGMAYKCIRLLPVQSYLDSADDRSGVTRFPIENRR